jgi:[NiFe] hydrogenase assembly HybE family chaperone
MAEGSAAEAAGGGRDARELDAAAKLTRTLETTFRKIEQERMRDIPILNPALGVACIGMRRHEDCWLSVLITPWFINILMLPGNEGDREAWSKMAAGTKLMHQFPAGSFEFICASEDGIGPYRMCSLFSPVLEFESQEAALATADTSLTALFDGSINPENEAAARQAEAQSASPKPQAAKFSRRDLMFGLTRSAS